jgi:ribosomal protein S18 acetylase RimI-like enzyme
MNLRPYTSTDFEACLAIFDSNVPRFFAPEERAEFIEFLEQPMGVYFVVEDELKALIGCGGYGEIKGIGVLTWGMVRHDLHKQGVGRFLLRERIAHLKAYQPHLREIHMNTSQHSVNFFEREGFRATKVKMNGFAPGLHEYHLKLEI